MIARTGTTSIRAALERPQWVKAPLFDSLVSGLDPDSRSVILDLGATSTALLELLGGFKVRIEVADLYGCGGIDALNAEQEAEQLDQTAERVLPKHSPSAPVDIVLCWDLFNYLPLPMISALARAIARRCRPGALVHCLIAYADVRMPARPRRYRPSSKGLLGDPSAVSEYVAAPRYTPEALGAATKLSIERVVLLADGMQEFLFRLR